LQTCAVSAHVVPFASTMPSGQSASESESGSGATIAELAALGTAFGGVIDAKGVAFEGAG